MLPHPADTAWNRLLHNETAFLIQRRLQHAGVPMVVLPVQLDLRAARENRAAEARRSLLALPEMDVSSLAARAPAPESTLSA